MSSAAILKLLPKVDHYDKDERYMCLSDMTNELSKLQSDQKLEAGTERKVVVALLGRLEKDTSNDVQAIAVKCLSVLVTRISETSITEICDTLSKALLQGAVELRDVYAIGVRAVITETPSTTSMVSAITGALVTPLLNGMSGKADAGKKSAGVGGGSSSSSSTTSGSLDTRSICFDIATELCKRLGAAPALEAHHSNLLSAMYAGLLDPSPALRKRAITSLGTLAPCLSDTLLEQLVAQLLSFLEKAGKGSADARVHVQALGSVVRAVGPRLGRSTGRVVPLLLAQLGDPVASASDDSANSDAMNELRETVLAALESFFGGKGKSGGLGNTAAASMVPFLDSIVRASLGWLRFDPNYAYGEEEEGGGGDDDMEGEEDEDAYGDDDEDGYGETDDDSSWKSRRAAARVLSAIVTAAASGALRSSSPSSPSPVSDLTNTLGKALAGRVKEREETVRLEVLAAASSLVLATHTVCGRGEDLDAHGSTLPKGVVHVANITTGTGGGQSKTGSAQSPEAVVATSTSFLSWLPSLLSSLLRALKTPGASMIKTRTVAATLVRTTVAVLDTDAKGEGRVAGALGPSLPSLLPALVSCTKEKSGPHAATLRLEAVSALHAITLALSAQADAQLLAPHIATLVATAVASCGDEYYRTQSAALRLLGTLPCILRPALPDTPSCALAATILPLPAFAEAVTALAAGLQPKLAAHDIDTEIKECALWSASTLLCHAGDVPAMASGQGAMMRLIADRAKSENTRVQALKAIAYCACSPLLLNLSESLVGLLPEFASFLRSASRPIRVAALSSLTAIVTCQGGRLGEQATALGPALGEVATPLIISEGDLQLTGLALGLATAVVTSLPPQQAGALLAASGLPVRITALACSGLLASAGSGTGTPASVSSFLQACIRCGLGGPLDFRPLLAGLVGEASRAGRSTAADAVRGVPNGLLMAARSMASIIAAAPVSIQQPALLSVLSDATGKVGGGLPDPNTTDGLVSMPLLSRLVVAEAGRLVDVPAMAPGAVEALLAAVAGGAGQGDELRTAAALALGGVVAGNPATTMAQLLSALHTAVSSLPAAGAAPTGEGSSSSSSGSTVFDVIGLLQALREALTRHATGESRAVKDTEPALPVGPVLTLLLSPSVAGCGHESVRSLAADAAGKACAIDPPTALPILTQAAATGNHTLIRAAAVTAVRHAIPFVVSGRSSSSLESLLTASLPSILGSAVSSPLVPGVDGTVYLAALASLTAVAYTAPAVLVNHAAWRPVPASRFSGGFDALFMPPAADAAPPAPHPSAPATLEGDGYLGVLTYACLPRPELVREVDLGPFKHRVDDAMPARKSALTALDALVDRTPAAVASALAPEANPGHGPYAGMSALLGIMLTTAVDPDMDVVMLSHSLVVRVCGAGLLPRLLPGVHAADALGDALWVPIKAPTTAGPAGTSGGGGAVPEGSPDVAGGLQDSVRTALRAVDAVARALPDAVNASRRLMELYTHCSKSEATRTVFAAVRAEALQATAAGMRTA